jgi:predicted ATPase/DNA-binding XRE family transcriptional regulator
VRAPPSRSFAELLRGHRTAAGLSQEALAERAKISLAAVAKLERGARQRPYRTTVALLADALSLPTADRVELERAANPRRVGALSQANEPTIKLPVRFSSFVGRERDLEKIVGMLETHRLVSLVGAGGIGKTRLAVRGAELFLTQDSEEHALDAVWFVDFSVITEGAMVPTVISSSLGLDRYLSIDSLVSFLRPNEFLLILDNCEHLMDSVSDAINAILLDCPGARILATSRQALSIEGEHVYRVLPMRVPPLNALSASEALEFDTIQLFRDRAAAVDSRFELDDSVAPAVASICRRIDGIALGIELAAARINAFSAATIAEQLGERLPLLANGVRISVPRHKTMNALFDWSYELLDAPERELFRLASIFADGFTLDLLRAASSQHLGPDVAAVLGLLVDKSLIHCDVCNGPRYRLLEPARQYGREKLRENGELLEAARSHALALLALSEEFDERLEFIPDHVWNASILPERDNFRAAFEWALGADGNINIARQLVASRTATWNGFASGEVREWINAALKPGVEPTDSQLIAKLALIQAKAAVIFSPSWLENDKPTGRIDSCQRALALQLPANRRAVGTATYWLGVALRDSGSYDRADTALREAREIARLEHAQNEYVVATTSLGAVRYGVGDLVEARTLTLEVLHRSEGMGSVHMSAISLLAEIEFSSGAAEEALRLNERMARHYRDRSNVIGLAYALCNSAACLVELKRYSEAREHGRQSLRSSVAIGSVRSAFWAMQHLVAAAILANDARDGLIMQRAAQLLGSIDESASRRALQRDITERREYDKILDQLHRALGQTASRRYMADGKAWLEERAVEEALAI